MEIYDRLESVKVSGWKSIREMEEPLKLNSVNVMIGANGAGKSNLLSFFHLLNSLVGEQLADFVRRKVGGANSALHYGAKRTPEMSAELVFTTSRGENSYSFELGSTVANELVFTKERLRVSAVLNEGLPYEKSLGGGYETRLREEKERGNKTAEVVYGLLARCRRYHFHDTSTEANISLPCEVTYNYFLAPDAGNLAAMLYFYKNHRPLAYRRIVSVLRKVVPLFDDFDLQPTPENERQIRLQWRQKESDYPFASYQTSDGSLRMMALATLFLQPEENLPLLIVLDEPELGLHPYAVEILAELIQSVSYRTQTIVATQSPFLINYFQPEDVIVVDTVDGASQFRRLDSVLLADWLEDYSLGEIWEKNVIGGTIFP